MSDVVRTRSDRRFRPIRRSISRYGILEKSLRELQRKRTLFSISNIVCNTRILTPPVVKGLLRFTTGVRRVGDNRYEFDGDEIVVCNGTL
jgi:hypothetical protein